MLMHARIQAASAVDNYYPAAPGVMFTFEDRSVRLSNLAGTHCGDSVI
jgi:hypothetical protein